MGKGRGPILTGCAAERGSIQSPQSSHGLSRTKLKKGTRQMAAVNSVIDVSADGEVAVITLNSPPVNALSQAVREGLDQALRAAFADAKTKAVVIVCDGRTFVAGADIREFGKPRKPPGLKDFQQLFDGAPKPVVAAIHGTALGGGLELAMMCHYRVAVPSARCGLPEVNIGILPGGGGTQALPRVVGVEKALEMMTSGRHVSAKEAQASGILDETVAEGNLKQAAIDYAKKLIVGKKPIKRVRDLTDKIEAARKTPEVFANFRRANARKFRNMTAPENIIKCVEAAVSLPFDDGLKRESELSAELHSGPQAPAMRHSFFAEREAAKIPDVPDDTATLPVNTVGIIGAGTMGGGIAMNFANVGIPVKIIETKQEALDRGLSVIRKNYERTAQRGGM